jgi:hypothetical protein
MTAVALAIAVQAAGLSAPLTHAHPDEHTTEHHGGRTVHSHWAGHAQSHSSETLALEPTDHDRALFLNAFVAVATSSLSTPGLTHDSFELAVPPERAAHQVVETVRSHDPPSIASLSPRAPPAFLS